MWIVCFRVDDAAAVHLLLHAERSAPGDADADD